MKLIITDIDGTLLDLDGRLPKANIQAIQQAHQQGVQVALATIRKRDSTERIGSQLGVPCIKACQGGAAIYDEHNRLLQTFTIPLEFAQEIARLADDHDLPLLTTVDEVNYYGSRSPLPQFTVTRGVKVVRNVDALVGLPTRMIVRGERAANMLMKAFHTAPLRFVRHYTSDGALHDAVITHASATKEAALAFIFQRLNIAPHDTIAFGDAEADIGMLTQAGIGVAVGNARADVKAVANWVSPTAHDAGVAIALTRFVLH